MSYIKTSQINYKNFGRCLHITNDVVELLVPLHLGPRIIKYSFVNESNMLFEDIDRVVSEDLSSYEEYSDNKWYLYGGHRLWMSPEYMPSSYYPDNEDIVYEIIENKIKILGPKEEYNKVQKILIIELEENSSKVSITNEILNLSKEKKCISAWAITTLCSGGVSITPTNDQVTKFIPNKVFAYWPYTKFNDERMDFIENKYLKVEHDNSNYNPFKIGLNNTARWSTYTVGENVFIKSFDDIYSNPSDYSDFGVNFEIYTKELFLELETLSKLKIISQGEKVSLKEEWYIVKDNNKNIKDKVENAIKKIRL
ncbi:MAG: hypothetical protein RRZ84_02580 [Romboutsia sp.]